MIHLSWYAVKFFKKEEKMNRSTIKTKLLALLLSLSLILPLLNGCIILKRDAATKEEIIDSVSTTLLNDEHEYEFVSYYLRYWNLPRFDSEKALWAEYVFKTYYVYNGGLAKTLDHAAETARYFVENHYDTIDITNVTAVTDAVIDSYVRTVGDLYSFYRTPEASNDFTTDMSGKFGGIGVVVEYDHENESISVSSVILDSPAEAAGFKVGDKIIAVDGHTVEEIGYLNAVNYVRGEIGTNVVVRVMRDGTELSLTAKRAEIVERVVDSYVTEEGYGYILITDFKSITFEQFVEAYDALVQQNVKGFIFDLRYNPGGYVDSVCNVLSYLLPTDNVIMSCHYKTGDPTVLSTKDDVHPKTGAVADSVMKLPAVVLCNEYTASAGEIFTAALRDYNKSGLLVATTVGTKTFGKGIMQSSIYYKTIDKSSLTFTSAYYNPPSGVNYQGIGITPDITVENTETEDRQLDAAIKELTRLINEAIK